VYKQIHIYSHAKVEIYQKKNYNSSVWKRSQTIRPIGKVTVLLEGNEMFATESIYIMPNDSFENILSKDASASLVPR